MKPKKKEAIDRRRFLTKAATISGAGLAGAILMNTIDKSVLAGPSPSQTAILSKWAQESAYDFLIFSDGTNYYAKNGDTGKIDFTNTTPDIWALLNSIDTTRSAASVTVIQFIRASYTGSATFTPGLNKGYKFIGQGIGEGTTANTGTTLIHTGTGKAIDCSVNWGSPMTTYTAQIIQMRDIRIKANTANGIWFDLTRAAGSRFENVDFFTDNGASIVVGSNPVFLPTQSNISPHYFINVEINSVDIGIVCGADFFWARGLSTLLIKTCSIKLTGGETHSIVQFNHFNGAAGNPSLSCIRDERPANTMTDGFLALSMIHINGETSGLVYNNANGAYYVIVNSDFGGGAPYMDYATNIPVAAYASLASPYTTTSTTDVSTGMGVTLIGMMAKSVLNTAVWNLFKSTFRVKVSAQIDNNTIGDGVTISVYRSTSAIPAQGAAVGGGDVLIATMTDIQEGLASNPVVYSADFLDGGLGFAVSYYYYVTIKAVTGGTAEIKGGMAKATIYMESV